MDEVLVVGDGRGGFYVLPVELVEQHRVGEADVQAIIGALDDGDVEGFAFGKRTEVKDSHDRYDGLPEVVPTLDLGAGFAFVAPLKWSRDNGSVVLPR